MQHIILLLIYEIAFLNILNSYTHLASAWNFPIHFKFFVGSALFPSHMQVTSLTLLTNSISLSLHFSLSRSLSLHSRVKVSYHNLQDN